MMRALRLSLCAAVVLACGAALWAASAQSPRRELNIHPPLRLPSRSIAYDAERIIRTTLHEYLPTGQGRENETTGSYVTFGLPMKYLGGFIFDEEVPVFFKTYMGWEPDPGGEGGRIVDLHDAEGHGAGSVTESNGFFANISSFGNSSHPRLLREVTEAKQSGARFDGYRMTGQFSADTYWLGETYCGLDVFERDYPRGWHQAAGAIEGVDPPEDIEPPFDRPRLFGLPREDAGYRLIVECEDLSHPRTAYCRADEMFNDYVVVDYSFDGSLLCEIEDMIAAHMDLLRRSVVDERQISVDHPRAPLPAAPARSN